MKTLERQLAEYGDYQKELHGPVTASEFTLLGATNHSESSRSAKGLWIAFTAAAVVLLVALIPWLLRSEGAPPVISPEPSATTAPTSITAPAAVTPTEERTSVTTPAPATVVEGTDAYTVETATLGTLTWMKIDIGPYAAGHAGSPSAVWEDHQGYVISGHGTLLYSSDGQSWTTAPPSPELANYTAFRSRGSWAVAGNGEWKRASDDRRDLLRSNGSEWVAVNLVGPEAPWPELPVVSGDMVLVPEGDIPGAYWLSDSGEPFTYRSGPWPDGVWVHPAAGGGFVAFVDSYEDIGESGQYWRSIDGVTWTAHDVPQGVTSPHDLTSVIELPRAGASPCGYSILTNFGDVCSDYGNDPEQYLPRAWISTDGQPWEPAPIPNIDRESYGFVGGESLGGAGDLLFYHFGDFWVGHFSERPAR